MKYDIVKTSKFKRDYKRIKAQGRDTAKLEVVVRLLANGEQLPPEYSNHPLKGNWIGYEECHIESNWLLIYKIEKELRENPEICVFFKKM